MVADASAVRADKAAELRGQGKFLSDHTHIFFDRAIGKKAPPLCRLCPDQVLTVLAMGRLELLKIKSKSS